jgi:hypothetical protein
MAFYFSKSNVQNNKLNYLKKWKKFFKNILINYGYERIKLKEMD